MAAATGWIVTLVLLFANSMTYSKEPQECLNELVRERVNGP